MSKQYTINQVGYMVERLLTILAPSDRAGEWVSGMDLRTIYGLTRSEIAKYKECGLMPTKPFKKGSSKLLYDVSKISHLINKKAAAMGATANS